MKILHLKHNFLPESETFVYDQINGVKNSIVFSTYHFNKKLFPFRKVFATQDLGVLKFGYNEFMYRLFSRSPFLEKVVKKEGPDIAHAHFGNCGVFYLPLIKKFNIPFITSFYGRDASVLLRSGYWLKRYRKLFKEGDLFLALSNFVKKKLVSVGCNKNKIIVHRTGVDVKKFRFKKRSSNDVTKFLFVGRLVEKKGLAYLIKAFSDLNDCTLEIVGNGPLMNNMKCLVNSLGIKGSVIFRGSKSHDFVSKKMMESDIFVLPSVTARNGDTEGQGIVLLEAQATGIPVISTWHNGIPEAIKDGKNGLLAKPNDVKDLEDKMTFLIENKKLWSKFGRNGRKNVEKNFNMKIQIKKLESIYKNLK